MTLTPFERNYLVASHTAKAEKALDNAEKIVSITPDMSCRASYDAAFHMTSALLICESLEIPSSHEGLNAILHDAFVRGEQSIPREISSILGRLEKHRNDSAYRIDYNHTFESAENDLNDARRFCAFLSELLSEKKRKLEHKAKVERTLTDDEKLEQEIKDLNLIPLMPKIITKPTDLAEYKGKILHTDEERGYSVMHSGKIILTVHKHANLNTIPRLGEIVEINYTKNKSGTVRLIQR